MSKHDCNVIEYGITSYHDPRTRCAEVQNICTLVNLGQWDSVWLGLSHKIHVSKVRFFEKSMKISAQQKKTELKSFLEAGKRSN